jgi:hypothetical protein
MLIIKLLSGLAFIGSNIPTFYAALQKRLDHSVGNFRVAFTTNNVGMLAV